MGKKRATVNIDATPAPIPARADGWNNILTGLGTFMRDKRRAERFGVDERGNDRPTQEALWEGDDLCARAVELPVKTMLRNGFDLKIGDAEPEAADGDETPDEYNASAPIVGGGGKEDAFPPHPPTDPRMAAVPPPPTDAPKPLPDQDTAPMDMADDVMARFSELRCEEHLDRAGCFERGYGGSAILLGINDGQAMNLPLDLDNIQSFKWMNVLSPRELVATRYYADPRAPKYGEPELYRVQANVDVNIDQSSAPKTPGQVEAGSLQLVEVHESRLIVFPGIFVSNQQRIRRHGWGNSIFVRLMQPVADFQMAYGGAAHLMTDMSQAVYKVVGLAGLIASHNDAAITKRAQVIDMTRSVCRAILIDSQEDFERQATPLTGIPEMLDRFAHRLAAAAEMPVTLLMGMSPSGLNATGDADIRNWYDHIQGLQKKHLTPRIERLLRLIMLAKDGPTKGVEPSNWTVKHRPLWQLTDLEQATLRMNQSTTDVAYVTAGVLTPEEVAASRFGGTEYSTDTTIDVEGRKQVAADAAVAQKKRQTALGKIATPPPKTGDQQPAVSGKVDPDGGGPQP